MPAETTEARPAGGLRSLGRALSSRNYRLFFAGQGISLVGTWMSRIATGWLVFRLARPDPALLLGVVSFVSQSPTFFLAPLSGVLIDRWDRHRVLVLTQALSAAQSLLLALVAFFAAPGWGAITLVLLLGLVQGVLNAFDMPARQAFLVEMITRKEDLPNAIALNSSLVNSARLLGPTAAGVIIALTGEAWCFLIDAVSYLAVIAALLRMDVPKREPPAAPRAPVLRGLREGLGYAFGFPPIRALLLLLALVSLAGMPYTVLLPVFAEDVLGGGPAALGLLSGATGVGALAGALYLASRRSVLGLGRVIVLAAGLFGAALIAFSLSRALWLSLGLMALAGLGMMVQMAASNTILQTIVEDDKRGRVMSLYGMAFLGMAPFGSLLAGVVADRLGAPWAVLMGGAACVVAAAAFAWQLPRLREHVRPVYVRLGILPEVAAGLQAAAEPSPVPPGQQPAGRAG
jgi:MFS family permease